MERPAVERLRTAHDVDVIGAVVAAQVAAPVLRAAGGGTLLATSGGFADNPVPALASLSMGKAALRSAQTLIAVGVRDGDIHAATVTIAGAVKAGTDFDPNNIAELFWTAHVRTRPWRGDASVNCMPCASAKDCRPGMMPEVVKHPHRCLYHSWCLADAARMSALATSPGLSP